jgi:hypothetical protein
LIIPLANNKYDAAYCEYFTKRKWQVIPSLCEYTASSYTGGNSKFIYSSHFKRFFWDRQLVNKERVLKKGYQWQELADFKGIVHIPYNASTMSIFEQYTANIPLFFPSFDFMKTLRKKYYQQGVLSELSWNQVIKTSSGSVLSEVDEQDPNKFIDNEVMMNWVKLADYYDTEMMPHVTYFDSFRHLKKLLKNSPLKQISAAMVVANKQRRELIYSSWRKIVNTLKTRLER